MDTRRAFFFSDIEGSTRLLLRLGEEFDVCLAAHRAIVRAAAERHGGFEEGTEGDSFVIAFEDAASAARTAIEVQRGLAAHPWPPDAPVRVRVGLHVGDARFDEALGYRGMALHTAARVMSAGHGGQILVTPEFAADVQNTIEGFELIPLGSYRMKDLPTPIEIRQLLADGLQRQFPPLRATSLIRRARPPRYTSPLRGRADLLDRIGTAISAAGLVTLTGPPGTGKTRLAVEAVTAADRGWERSHFVDLASVGESTAVVSQIADVLDVRSDHELLAVIAARLNERPTVLVLDNCEHVVRSVSKTVDELLEFCPQATVLATSREPLGLTDERIVAVPPLSVSAEAGHSDAVAVFLDRADALGVDVSKEIGPITEICDRLDGIPLAIELAAGLTPVLHPQEIAQRLASRFDLLRGGEHRAMDRHRTLGAAVEWGYELLAPEEQRVLRALSVCSGWFDLATAEALTSEDAVGHIHRLVRTSWLIRQSEAGRSRFRMLETLKAFAEERARSAGELEVCRLHHAEYFFERALQPGTTFAETRVHMEAIEQDLRAALSWAADRRVMLDAAISAHVYNVRYWQTTPDWSENRRHLVALTAAVDAGAEVSDYAKSELFAVASFLIHQLGDHEEGITLAERAVESGRRSGHIRALARSTRMLGMLLRMVDPHRALTYLDQSVAVVQEAKDEGVAPFASMALNDRAVANLYAYGMERALTDMRAALEVATRYGDAQSQMFAHSHIGEMLERGGDIEGALRSHERAESLLDRAGHQMAMLFLTIHRGRITQPGRTYVEMATGTIAGAQRLGSRLAHIDALRTAASAELAWGDPETARCYVDELTALGRVGQESESETLLLELALARALGDADGVRNGLLALFEFARAIRSPAPATSALWLTVAWGMLDENLTPRAETALEQAVPVFGLGWQEVLAGGRDRPSAAIAPFETLDLAGFNALADEVAVYLSQREA